MSSASKSSLDKHLKRRKFLSRTAAVGGMALFGASTGPVRAAKSLANDSPGAHPARRLVGAGNATVNDFNGLLGKRFRLSSAGGITHHARLIETSSPKVRRALRFRREHFSIVFDVPRGVELAQGQYRISHPQIGSMNLFMVPVDLPGKHNRLEAVFT